MKYKYPECGEISDKELWQECETYCEDCGSHPALLCRLNGISRSMASLTAPASYNGRRKTSVLVSSITKKGIAIVDYLTIRKSSKR